MYPVRSALLVALVLAGPVRAEPPKLDAKTAETKLKKLRDAEKVAVADYTGAQWEEVRDKKPDWKKERDAFDKLTDGLSKVESGAKSLAGTLEKNASVRGPEATRFLKLLEKPAPNNAIEALDKLRKALDTAPAGVVAEGTDGAFKLTADEFATEPKKATDRVKARFTAMQANLKQLEENAKQLDAVADRAKASRDSVKKADDFAEAFIQRGGIADLNRNAVHKHFDGPKLTKQYGDLAGIAADKVKAVKKAAEAQKKQIAAFLKAAKDEFQINLSAP